MGKRGREIVGMYVERLLDLLNRAYASEWLAYYQCWLGAKLIKGPMKDAAELTLHATEELKVCARTSISWSSAEAHHP